MPLSIPRRTSGMEAELRFDWLMNKPGYKGGTGNELVEDVQDAAAVQHAGAGEHGY
jgi:hypothetical protein